jgi:hypothetical protein
MKPLISLAAVMLLAACPDGRVTEAECAAAETGLLVLAGELEAGKIDEDTYRRAAAGVALYCAGVALTPPAALTEEAPDA